MHIVGPALLGLCTLLFSADACAREIELLCEAEPSVVTQILCHQDKRLCTRAFRIDTNSRTVVQLPNFSGGERRRNVTRWSETYIEFGDLPRTQLRPDGTVAYVVKESSVLNRLTGGLATTAVTETAEGGMLSQEEAMAIAQSLGPGLRVVPSAQTTRETCRVVTRVL